MPRSYAEGRAWMKTDEAIARWLGCDVSGTGFVYSGVWRISDKAMDVGRPGCEGHCATQASDAEFLRPRCFHDFEKGASVRRRESIRVRGADV